MNGISLNGESKFSPYRAGLGQGGVGSTHNISPMGNRVLPLEEHNDDLTR